VEQEAFRNAVRACPDDPLPRLVFADWLDEYGDPLAAYVRAEAELLNHAIGSDEWLSAAESLAHVCRQPESCQGGGNTSPRSNGSGVGLPCCATTPS
jgi:uncharacterized protein (TIGR02996 family)